MDRGNTLTHKGYTLVQSSNNHYSIFEDATKRFVSHAQCTKRLTSEEMKEQIELFIIIKSWKNDEDI